MSLFVQGAKLPTVEGDKSIKAEIRCIGGKWEFGIMTGGYYCSQEWTFYPLSELPPHGRLGDLDALAEKIDGIWDCNDMVFKPVDHCCNVPEDCKGCKWAQTKDCIQRMVENAPTIIEAEEGET